ncbi:MAG: DNA methyltransferase [Cytophagales bacterium]|nr:MAG: DNA methyltransferase [Cytophagales bacterium]
MTLEQYIQNINAAYKRGTATEHTYRGDLKQLIESMVPDIAATNEPKRIACGAPDYVLTRKDVPVGFIEAKDVADKDLEGAKKTGNKEQFDRYKTSLNNLIFTDYIDFHIYRNGVLVNKIAIAELKNGAIVPLKENFATFTNLLKDFCSQISQTITSPKKLAEMMAGKAKLLADVIEKALLSDEDTQENSTLKDQLTAFKDILIHDITPKSFADVYAQTIAYGMFAARYHDPTLPTFSRQEAYELIPKSNPFLKKLFGYIAGLDVDDRIKWIVDDLVNIFLACNVAEILKDYGKATKMEDPIIHFYEDFLSEYDPTLRKARGVWYTPAPVVNFIVRAVDDILKIEFGLQKGLADTSKTKVKTEKQGKKTEQEVHKVQILDPATGTGTFLAEVVKHIYQNFKGQQGVWNQYVTTDLLPRLNGFELLMASYAMAHLKLDLLLTETGYQPQSNERLRIYLTNSLEESHPDTGTLFAQWLSNEANEANQIKRDAPVMCVIGNPPYSGESQNKGEWIMKLMEDYKKEPEGKEKLKERNSKTLNDDYVKFLRYGQYFIEKNGSGILAFINPHGFLDNITYRGMRWNLLKTYDKIYTIDLHGNSKKKETTPDGNTDQNVFEIMQGVSINLFVKTGKKKANELGKVFHFDLFGKRELKYDFLLENSLKTISFKELEISKPNFFFISKTNNGSDKYNDGISIDSLFLTSTSGIKTHSDSTLISFEKYKSFNQYYHYRPFDIRNIEYDLSKVQRHRYNVMKNMLENNLAIMTSRQLSTYDFQHILVSKYLVDMCAVSLQTKETTYAFPLYLYPGNKLQTNTSKKYELDEIQLLELRKEELLTLIDSSEKSFRIIQKMYESVKNPDKEIQKLYNTQVKSLQKLKLELKEVQDKLKSNATQTQTVVPFIVSQERIPNLHKEIVKQIAEKLGLTFTNEKENKENTFAPIDLLDYIYAVLHSPTYREKYKEFLKIDFPRVPYPKDVTTFWNLVKLGGQIRQIHLLESPTVENYITQYLIDGDNTVSKVKYQDGKVYINDTQYFDNVPQIAWEFYIGGYQPAQKWLKDRKDRQLDFDDIFHYQKIIVALSETDRLMKEIDKIEIE